MKRAMIALLAAATVAGVMLTAPKKAEAFCFWVCPCDWFYCDAW